MALALAFFSRGCQQSAFLFFITPSLLLGICSCVLLWLGWRITAGCCLLGGNGCLLRRVCWILIFCLMLCAIYWMLFSPVSLVLGLWEMLLFSFSSSSCSSRSHHFSPGSSWTLGDSGFFFSNLETTFDDTFLGFERAVMDCPSVTYIPLSQRRCQSRNRVAWRFR